MLTGLLLLGCGVLSSQEPVAELQEADAAEEA